MIRHSLTLNAALIKNQKMFIHNTQANFLINKYFKDEKIRKLKFLMTLNVMYYKLS